MICGNRWGYEIERNTVCFDDVKDPGQRKRTQMEIFLAERNQEMPWRDVLTLIAPQSPGPASPADNRSRCERCHAPAFRRRHQVGGVDLHF